MNLKIILTSLSILSFSTFGLLPNLKADEKNFLSIAKDLDKKRWYI